MKPTIMVVQKHAQGSNVPESALCQTCMAWVMQLLVRIQADITTKLGGPWTKEEKKKPWFQVKNLTCFSHYQVVELDKTHQYLGMLRGSGRSKRGKEVQVRFQHMPNVMIGMTEGQQP